MGVAEPSAAAAKLRSATRYLGLGSSKPNQAVEEALAFAGEAHDGQYRRSGEEYVVHPIETACILAEMRVDVDTVVAGLLHDVVEDTDWCVPSPAHGHRLLHLTRTTLDS